MEVASDARGPFIKCSPYLKPVSVSVRTHLNVTLGASLRPVPNPNGDADNKGSYYAAALLSQALQVTIIFS